LRFLCQRRRERIRAGEEVMSEPDWFEKIKRECDVYDRYEPPNNMRLLITEVERLRRDLHDCTVSHQKRNAELAALEEEVERLRKENVELREAISPARIGRNVDYYIAVALLGLTYDAAVRWWRRRHL